MKSLKSFNQHIEESNEIFSNASKAEKRVIIAKDVIARMRLGQFQAMQGEVFDMDDSEIRFSKKSIQNFFKKKRRVDCNVCAKGGLFLGYVGRVNEFNFCDVESGNDTRHFPTSEMRKLMEIFTADQLDLIECAFENTPSFGDHIDRFYLVQSAASFGKKYPNSKKRMIAICENIISNKGTFKP